MARMQSNHCFALWLNSGLLPRSGLSGAWHKVHILCHSARLISACSVLRPSSPAFIGQRKPLLQNLVVSRISATSSFYFAAPIDADLVFVCRIEHKAHAPWKAQTDFTQQAQPEKRRLHGASSRHSSS